MKIAQKIAITLIALSMLPFSTAAYVYYKNGRETILKNNMNHLKTVNDLRSDELHRWFEDKTGSLRAMARRPLVRVHAETLDSDNSPEFKRKLALVSLVEGHFNGLINEKKGIFQLDVIRASDGKIIASSDPEDVGKLRESERYYIEGQKGVFIQNAYYSLGHEKTISTVGIPLYDSGDNVVAVLTAHIDLREVSRIMTSIRGDALTEETYLINKFNFMITDSRFLPDAAMKETVYSEGAKRVLMKINGSGIYEDYRKVPVLGTYKWLPEFEMGILTEIEVAEVFAPIENLKRTTILFSLLITLLVSALAVIIARNITDPIKDLIKGAEEIGSGNLDYHFSDKGQDEVASLASAFNAMALKMKNTVSELYEAKHDLENKVEERTQDLLNSNITLKEEVLEKKSAQDALQESEERFKTLIENAPDGILVFDEDHGHFVQVNQKAIDMLGYSRDELLMKHWLDISVPVQPDGRSSDELGRKLRNDSMNNESVLTEWVFQHSDGSELVTELILNLLPSPHRKLIRASLLDITSRKIAERALQLQYNLNKVFMEAMPCFAVLLRSDRTIIAANKIALDFGAKHGQTCFKSMAGFEKPCWWCLGPKCLEENEPQHVVVEDRGINWDAYWVPIEEDLYLHYAFDITEKVRAAEDQQRLINQMQHVQKLESLGVLAGGIAHDFNNLLMGILGNASLALNRMKQSTPTKKHVEQIELSAQKAADLTNQMLAYSGRGQFMLSKVYLNVAVNEIKQLLQTVVSKDVVMKFDISDDLFPVDADITQLNQVIMNLVINASDAIDNKDGQVCVSTGSIYCDKEYLTSTYLDDPLPEGKYIYFQVVDNGRGMDESTLERIFDPFFSTKDTGRGLGLAAVLGIIRGHRGAIRIESEIGKGSTFTVLLPEVDHAQEAIAETVDKKSGRYIYNDMTVLLVDDDDTVRDVTKDMLEELGFTVITAENGKKGFDLYKKRKTQINLVILDMTMPGMTGDEVFLKVREIDKDIPVILSSGYSELETATALIEKGLSGFIQKPYKQDDLLSKINEVLGRGN